MALDFWADHYSRKPNDNTVSEEFENDEFEADVAAMLADDDWEDVAGAQ